MARKAWADVAPHQGEGGATKRGHDKTAAGDRISVCVHACVLVIVIDVVAVVGCGL